MLGINLLDVVRNCIQVIKKSPAYAALKRACGTKCCLKCTRSEKMWTESNVVTYGVPGGRKTATLVDTIVQVIADDTGICRVLALSFTKAAVNELKNRVMAEVSVTGAELECATLHSFANKVLVESGYSPLSVDTIISEFMDKVKDPEFRDSLPKFDLVLIDEAQDFNRDQFDATLKLLMHWNCAVRLYLDMNQSIYGFQGAEPHRVMDFIHFMKSDPSRVTLFERRDVTFRCPPKVVNLLNAHLSRMVGHYPSEWTDIPVVDQIVCAHADHTGSHTPTLHVYGDGETEYERVRFLVTDYLERHEDALLKDIAILSRSNARLDHLAALMIHSFEVQFKVVEDDDEDTDGIRMLSQHGSKGTTFRLIICLNSTEKSIRNSVDTRDGVLEEARLFFVACSRTNDELHALAPSGDTMCRFITQHDVDRGLWNVEAGHFPLKYADRDRYPWGNGTESQLPVLLQEDRCRHSDLAVSIMDNVEGIKTRLHELQAFLQRNVILHPPGEMFTSAWKCVRGKVAASSKKLWDSAVVILLSYIIARTTESETAAYGRESGAVEILLSKENRTSSNDGADAIVKHVFGRKRKREGEELRKSHLSRMGISSATRRRFDASWDKGESIIKERVMYAWGKLLSPIPRNPEMHLSTVVDAATRNHMFVGHRMRVPKCSPGYLDRNKTCRLLKQAHSTWLPRIQAAISGHATSVSAIVNQDVNVLDLTNAILNAAADNRTRLLHISPQDGLIREYICSPEVIDMCEVVARIKTSLEKVD